MNSNHSFLIFSHRLAWEIHTAWESAIAKGLTLRGHNVKFLACSADLPLCGMTNVEYGPPGPENCRQCETSRKQILDHLDFPVHYLQSYKNFEETHADILANIAELDIEGCTAFTYKGIALGELAVPNLDWYLKADHRAHCQSLHPFHQFIATGVYYVEAFSAFLTHNPFDRILTLNGKFLAEAVLIEVARGLGIECFTYEAAPSTNCLRGFNRDIAADLNIDSLWEQYGTIPLTCKQAQWVDQYLENRKIGKWGRYGSKWSFKKTGSISPPSGTKRQVSLFPSVMWDSAAYGRNLGFSNMRQWIKTTIAYFIEKKDIHLTIRVHPGESNWFEDLVTNERTETYIQQAYPDLPSHIALIPSNDLTNSYDLAASSNLVLVYTGSLGWESFLAGAEVIVAGVPYYAGHGFLEPPSSKQAYLDRLDKWLCKGSVSETQAKERELCRRFIYTFYNRGLISTARWVTEPGWGRYQFVDISKTTLLNDPGMERICTLLCE